MMKLFFPLLVAMNLMALNVINYARNEAQRHQEAIDSYNGYNDNYNMAVCGEDLLFGAIAYETTIPEFGGVYVDTAIFPFNQ